MPLKDSLNARNCAKGLARRTMDKAVEIKEFLLRNGCCEVGFCRLADWKDGTLLKDFPGSEGLDYGISLVVKLSDAVIDGILEKPTHVYFQHYRTVNALIDHLALRAGILLEKAGYRYLPVAASQSIEGLQGLFQHKTAARLSGLGGIGKSGLFLSHKFGSRVRLGTLLTNMPVPAGTPYEGDICGTCQICAKACPAMAIGAEGFSMDEPEGNLDRRACSEYMKRHFQRIGRGAVCGICVKNCPKGRI